MGGWQIAHYNLRLVTDMEDNFFNKDIIFDSKADAVPFNYRISYKVSLICMIIGKCCGKRGCSATKLQMINASINTSKCKKELLDLIKGVLISEITLIRFDPAISRVINYAFADNLIFQQGNGLFRLADKGKKLIEEIYKDQTLMSVEKDFFGGLSNKLTEDMIVNIAQNWRLEDA